jgi:hypothetical protein
MATQSLMPGPLGDQNSFGKQRANQWKDEGVLASPPASKESLRVGE